MAKKGTPKRSKRQPRKSLQEMKNELIQRQYEMPEIVNEQEYTKLLDATILHRFGRGIELLDHVKEILSDAAEKTDRAQDRKNLTFAIDQVEESIVAFEYGSLKYNAPLRRERMIMWPVKEKKKKR
jgi:hypothetical protein